MIGFLLHILGTKSRFAAAEAFGTPPRSQHSRHLRMVALALFVAASAFMLVAALTFTVGERNALSEFLGWSGVVCIQLCVVCGHCYALVNRERRKHYPLAGRSV
jgi:hypothetical protein